MWHFCKVKEYISSTFCNVLIKTLCYLQYFEIRDVCTEAHGIFQ